MYVQKYSKLLIIQTFSSEVTLSLKPMLLIINKVFHRRFA